MTDSFGRKHDYLRLSLTDKCNFRCTYCMPNEKMRFMPDSKLLTVKEIEAIVAFLSAGGLKKLRFTGGEPLARPEAPEIIETVARFPLRLAMTTNGFWLDKHLDVLKKNGVLAINVSIDSLKREKFKAMAQRDAFDKVWDNIQLLVQEGFQVKLNTVLIKGVNDDEINDFVQLAEKMPVGIRFIEFMPFKGNLWDWEKKVSLREIQEKISSKFEYTPLESMPNDTAKVFKVKGFLGDFGIISSLTAPFCGTCNRLRLTADGKLKNCLFDTGEMDVAKALRQGGDLAEVFQASLLKKHKERGGMMPFSQEGAADEYGQNRSMISIGG